MTIERNSKIAFLGSLIALTLAIHYGLVLENIFGHSEWVHTIHGRFCYIPIAVAAVWFGLRGGLLAATTISVLVLPYIFGLREHPVNLSSEFVEIIFYFAVAALIGALIDREMLIRRKQEETQLQLERSHKLSMVGRMAAGVAHEIKNPLASIKGAAEILSDSSTSEKDKEEFRKIALNEIKRVNGTVKEFLDFARPKEPKLEKMNLSSAISAGIRQMERQLKGSGIRMSSDIQENLFIYGDSEKMHQVFLNLILNAIDASETDSAIDVVLRDADTGGVLLKIRDSGKGIDQSEIEDIFEPFYTTKPSGTGLGLTIVKAIIENHNGRIQIHSEPGVGTEIEVFFPEYKET